MKCERCLNESPDNKEKTREECEEEQVAIDHETWER